MKENNDFEYRYVAPTAEERREIESIRDSYKPKSTSIKNIERIRKLDSKVKNIPTMLSLIVGIVGLLIFGLGMAMILEWKIMIWGVIVSFIGVVPISLAYPIFRYVFRLMKDKYSSEIIKLSDEILNDEKK